MKIGTQIHAFTPATPAGWPGGEEQQCWTGWVTGWDQATDRVAVSGFRSPQSHVGPTALGMFIGVDVPLLAPSETPDPELGPEGDYPAVISVHLPGDCPWER